MINKKIGSLFLLLLVALLLFTGCSSNSPINTSSDSNTPDSESYTLTVITEGEGNVIEEEIITTADYEKGSEVKLTAVADETNDWLFSHWEGDHNDNENPIEVIMDGNKTITAVFQSKVLIGSEPYEITNWYQLDDVRNWLSASHILMEDLNEQSLGYSKLIGVPSRDNPCWDPIIGDELKAYAGNFNGNNKVISGLYINRENKNYIGLFGKSIGTIKNLGIEIVNLTGNNNVGGLVGVNEGDIINCNVSGTIAGNENVGGLTGKQIGGLISDSSATGEISGSRVLGGLVGDNQGTIFKSYAQADVTGENNYIGGLIGINLNTRVEDSYAIGPVTGEEYVGGLIGYANDTSYIKHTYSSGDIFGTLYRGGLIGFNGDSTQNNIVSSYWDIEGGYHGITGSAGGDGKTTSEMVQEETFVGWDYTNTWNIEEGETYPYLKWQADNIPNIPTG